MDIIQIALRRFNTEEYIRPDWFEELQQDLSAREEAGISKETLDTIIGYVTRIEAGDYPTVEVTGDVDKGRLIIMILQKK